MEMSTETKTVVRIDGIRTLEIHKDGVMLCTDYFLCRKLSAEQLDALIAALQNTKQFLVGDDNF